MSSSMMMTDITDSNPKDILTFCFVTFLRLPLCLCLLNVCLFFLLSVANSRFVHHVVSFSLSLHLLLYRTHVSLSSPATLLSVNKSVSLFHVFDLVSLLMMI